MVHFLRYSAGVRPPKRGVGSVGVVLLPPALDNDLSLQEGAELFDVEELVAHAAVEALDEGVLPW